jgi:hypothetical protein
MGITLGDLAGKRYEEEAADRKCREERMDARVRKVVQAELEKIRIEMKQIVAELKRIRGE